MGFVGDRLSLSIIVMVALAFFYGSRRRKLERAGHHWPRRRTLSFCAALAIVAVATLPPLASEQERLFSANAAQHILLYLFAPLLFCSSGALRLVFDAASSGWQAKAREMTTRPAVRFISSPVITWVLFSGSIVALYATPLYELSLRHWWLHELVHLHLLVVGVAFFWPVLGPNPHPWKMPHGARMVYLLLTLPVHAFLALALIAATDPQAAAWYLETTGRTLPAVLADQDLGAIFMWAAGDLVALGAVTVVVGQWVRDDEKRASEEDDLIAAS